MAEIINITDSEVKIGKDDGQVIVVPIANINYPNPKVGDQVKLYKDGTKYIVRSANASASSEGVKSINKHVFVWVFSFMLGGFGVDRFVRGKVASGIFKLLFGWATLGIWPLIDWIIAMSKAYGSAYSNTEEISFDESGNYTR